MAESLVYKNYRIIAFPTFFEIYSIRNFRRNNLTVEVNFQMMATGFGQEDPVTHAKNLIDNQFMTPLYFKLQEMEKPYRPMEEFEED